MNYTYYLCQFNVIYDSNKSQFVIKLMFKNVKVSNIHQNGSLIIYVLYLSHVGFVTAKCVAFHSISIACKRFG